MPQPTQWPDGLQAEAPEKIPPLHNIAPSILVPLRDDILGPEQPEPPRDRVGHLKRILETIDYQRECVKENLFYMFEREKRRLVMEAAELERARGVAEIKPGPPPSEVDEMIANMEAPAVQGKDYEIRNMDHFDIGAGAPFDASLRDRTVFELLRMVERGLRELQMYEAFINGIKGDYLGRLEVEIARIEEAGKRPEERSG